jgi:hypothetical protein
MEILQMTENTTTIATKVDQDANLVQDFEEYCERNSMQSKSEGVRTLMREGLDNTDTTDDSQTETDSDADIRLLKTALVSAIGSLVGSGTIVVLVGAYLRWYDIPTDTDLELQAEDMELLRWGLRRHADTDDSDLLPAGMSEQDEDS